LRLKTVDLTIEAFILYCREFLILALSPAEMRKPFNIFTLALFLFCSCRVSYVSFRPEQNMPHNDTAMVTRVYIDRFGDLYPDTVVPIKINRFRVNGCSTNRNIASLYHYFIPHPKRLKKLADFYGVSPDSSASSVFREAQRRISAEYIRRINATIVHQQAGRVVFLVHGFNDPMAEAEYVELQTLIVSRHYPADKRPVFVDVHWDGLNAHSFDGVPVAKVWQPALLNSRYASIRLRALMVGLERENKTPVVIITHSLGGGVALGAAFNTTHKWEMINWITPKKDRERLGLLMDSPTPLAPLRIGMAAPAIPGEQTFVDFNARKPKVIGSSHNNIGMVVVGYNYDDYAVSKELAGIKLAAFYGSTSLGCNLTTNKPEINKVFDEMAHLGYGKHTKIIVPLEFRTPFRIDSLTRKSLSTREHDWHFYIENKVMGDMLDRLFAD
jgi:hypothetical protein